MERNKPKLWTGQDLSGTWLISYKIDGVRAFLDPVKETATSYNGKPLYGLDHVLSLLDTSIDAEIFCGSFKETIEIVRCSKNLPRQIKLDEVFMIKPFLDPKLIIGTFSNPSKYYIEDLLELVLNNGYEGLVIQGLEDSNEDKWYKIKKNETHDVEVLGCYIGKGKHEGRLGGFITTKGRVGTGFTDKQREEFWKDRYKLIGTVVEIECLELTENGKFRHPKFIRTRFDKDIKDCN